MTNRADPPNHIDLDRQKNNGVSSSFPSTGQDLGMLPIQPIPFHQQPLPTFFSTEFMSPVNDIQSNFEKRSHQNSNPLMTETHFRPFPQSNHQDSMFGPLGITEFNHFSGNSQQSHLESNDSMTSAACDKFAGYFSNYPYRNNQSTENDKGLDFLAGVATSSPPLPPLEPKRLSKTFSPNQIKLDETNDIRFSTTSIQRNIRQMDSAHNTPCDSSNHIHKVHNKYAETKDFYENQYFNNKHRNGMQEPSPNYLFLSDLTEEQRDMKKSLFRQKRHVGGCEESSNVALRPQAQGMSFINQTTQAHHQLDRFAMHSHSSSRRRRNPHAECHLQHIEKDISMEALHPIDISSSLGTKSNPKKKDLETQTKPNHQSEINWMEPITPEEKNIVPICERLKEKFSPTSDSPSSKSKNCRTDIAGVSSDHHTPCSEKKTPAANEKLKDSTNKKKKRNRMLESLQTNVRYEKSLQARASSRSKSKRNLTAPSSDSFDKKARLRNNLSPPILENTICTKKLSPLSSLSSVEKRKRNSSPLPGASSKKKTKVKKAKSSSNIQSSTKKRRGRAPKIKERECENVDTSNQEDCEESPTPKKQKKSEVCELVSDFDEDLSQYSYDVYEDDEEAKKLVVEKATIPTDGNFRKIYDKLCEKDNPPLSISPPSILDIESYFPNDDHMSLAKVFNSSKNKSSSFSLPSLIFLSEYTLADFSRDSFFCDGTFNLELVYLTMVALAVDAKYETAVDFCERLIEAWRCEIEKAIGSLSTVDEEKKNDQTVNSVGDHENSLSLPETGENLAEKISRMKQYLSALWCVYGHYVMEYSEIESSSSTSESNSGKNYQHKFKSHLKVLEKVQFILNKSLSCPFVCSTFYVWLAKSRIIQRKGVVQAMFIRDNPLGEKERDFFSTLSDSYEEALDICKQGLQERTGASEIIQREILEKEVNKIMAIQSKLNMLRDPGTCVNFECKLQNNKENNNKKKEEVVIKTKKRMGRPPKNKNKASPNASVRKNVKRKRSSKTSPVQSSPNDVTKENNLERRRYPSRRSASRRPSVSYVDFSNDDADDSIIDELLDSPKKKKAVETAISRPAVSSDDTDKNDDLHVLDKLQVNLAICENSQVTAFEDDEKSQTHPPVTENSDAFNTVMLSIAGDTDKNSRLDSVNRSFTDAQSGSRIIGESKSGERDIDTINDLSDLNNEVKMKKVENIEKTGQNEIGDDTENEHRCGTLYHCRDNVVSNDISAIGIDRNIDKEKLEAVTPIKKRIGRPPKNKNKAPTDVSCGDNSTIGMDRNIDKEKLEAVTPIKKRMGRPPKNKNKEKLEAVTPVKKRMGRPPKNKNKASTDVSCGDNSAIGMDRNIDKEKLEAVTPIKKRRGRPPKNKNKASTDVSCGNNVVSNDISAIGIDRNIDKEKLEAVTSIKKRIGRPPKNKNKAPTDVSCGTLHHCRNNVLSNDISAIGMDRNIVNEKLEAVTPIKKRMGRPPKNKNKAASTDVSVAKKLEKKSEPKKKRGRKRSIESSPTNSTVSSPNDVTKENNLERRKYPSRRSASRLSCVSYADSSNSEEDSITEDDLYVPDNETNIIDMASKSEKSRGKSMVQCLEYIDLQRHVDIEANRSGNQLKEEFLSNQACNSLQGRFLEDIEINEKIRCYSSGSSLCSSDGESTPFHGSKVLDVIQVSDHGGKTLSYVSSKSTGG